MEKQEYLNIFKNEKSHFFYRANHALFLSFVTNYATGRQKLKILDAGCGTGLLAKKLKKFGQVTGIDINPQALAFSKKRGIKVKKASVDKLPFKTNSLDLIVSMDVLYHKEVDDKKALAEFFRALKKRGRLILRVPANPFLYSSHDREVHTRERYTRQSLLKKLKKTGFVVEKMSFVNSTLFLPALLKVLVEKLAGAQNSHSGISHLPSFINLLILALLTFENFILRFVDLPFGIGLFTVARKG